MQEYQGYRKIKASELPRKEQERLRSALQHDLAEALVKSIRAQPPEIELREVELVLRPGEDTLDWGRAADCGTCGTCVTCVTCVTS